MRLGLMMGYSGSQITIDIDLIKEAERLGYASVWTAEAWGSDAVSPLAWVGAQTSKIKLGTAIIGISSIHLLKTFINAANYDVKVLMWQTIIHATFLLSALAIAATDRLMAPSHGPAH